MFAKFMLRIRLRNLEARMVDLKDVIDTLDREAALIASQRVRASREYERVRWEKEHIKNELASIEKIR